MHIGQSGLRGISLAKSFWEACYCLADVPMLGL